MLIDRIKAWTPVIREMMANLAPVALSVMLTGLVFILWLGGWQTDTEGDRIAALSTIAIIITVLMGAGMFWLWRLLIERLRIGNAAASIEAEFDHEGEIGKVKINKPEGQ